MEIRHILFDVDNTLYRPQAGLMAELDRRIATYLARELNLQLPEAQQLQVEYCWQYGSCANGVLQDAVLDLERFLTEIHTIDIRRFLAPDRMLASSLDRLHPEKWVFTNAPVEHARRVLEALGVADRFQGTFDIRFLGFVGKPDLQAYRRVIGALGARADECVMVEDTVRNLCPAKALGMKTILVARDGIGPRSWADAVVQRLEELPGTLAGLRYMKARADQMRRLDAQLECGSHNSSDII